MDSYFFEEIDNVGFIELPRIGTGSRKVSRRDEVEIPLVYNEALSYFSDDVYREYVQTILNSVSVFLRTKYFNSSNYNNWIKLGKLPYNISKKMIYPNITERVKKYVKLQQQVTEYKDRVKELESLEKRTKRQEESRIMNTERIENTSNQAYDLEQKLSMAFGDLESSFGGEF